MLAQTINSNFKTNYNVNYSNERSGIVKRNLIALCILTMCLLLVGACASIPKDTVVLSSSVTDGIKKMQIENEKVIKALSDVQRGILDENYGNIYASVSKKYLVKHPILPGTVLTPKQQMDRQMAVSANVTAIRDKLIKDIQGKEDALLKQSRANSAKVIEINEYVQKYLQSLSELKEANDKIRKSLKDITGVDVGKISESIKNKVGSL
jgi:hypothetical protein